MKTTIIKVLDEAYNKLKDKLPEVKTIFKNIDIEEVSPKDLPSFMKENDVPDNAYFYFNYDEDVSQLQWSIDVPVPPENRLLHIDTQFSNKVFNLLCKKLVGNGYKRRVPVSFLSTEKLYKTSVSEMYLNKNFDMLVEYYSFFFEKINI